MTNQLHLKEVSSNYKLIKGQPLLIACVPKEDIRTLFPDWSWLNLGLILAENILNLPSGQRKHKVADYVQEVIASQKEDKLIVENIDLLFNPHYELDVLQVLAAAARTKKLVVIWEGRYDSGMLFYSELKLLDYHSYDPKQYNALCITD
ncbi:MAG: BREX-3 system P-loop-containing protein BrxF [Desulfitobacteriia bacterium]|jgi:hypothetical protein